MNIKEAYEPAMLIKTQEQADKYFAFLVNTAMEERPELTREAAEKMQRHNLGYYAGYYDHATRVRVEHLYKCEHPFFGKASSNPEGDVETAARMMALAMKQGMELAKKIAKDAKK